jgi:hypothetical protein
MQHYNAKSKMKSISQLAVFGSGGNPYWDTFGGGRKTARRSRRSRRGGARRSRRRGVRGGRNVMAYDQWL